jgi:hypothetical protein
MVLPTAGPAAPSSKMPASSEAGIRNACKADAREASG